ncbi:hypothetical protein O4220_13380 [Rhodococcus ruber]|uniref:Uncharacterized protein n=1 Tax=Rhodococcus ruber TaxID=1830 RepID=A0ABT4MEU4_9NOCA|nr:hypothetical protein [Rhodococcus ruber]MCZ4519508.1 hypothetical protein [Rhodococcus ruber]
MSDAEMRAHVEKLRDPHRRDRLADAFESANVHGDKPVIDGWSGPDGDQSPNVIGYKKYSPGARFHPEIAAALDEAHLIKTTVPEPKWLGKNALLDYDHSNLRSGKCLPAVYPDPEFEDDEGGHELNVYDLSSRLGRQSFAESLDLATRGEAGRCVVIVDPGLPFVTPDLPLRFTDEGDIAPSAATFPVTYGYSSKRVAQLVMERFATQCRWCDSLHAEPEWGLLYSAGATVYIFPTCSSCKAGFDSDFSWDPSQLDYVVNDGWFRAAGYPSDENC